MVAKFPKGFSLSFFSLRRNYRDLKASGCQNLVKLGDFGHNGADVPDPYFFDGFEGFEHVYSMIESCVNVLLGSVRGELVEP